MLRLLLTVLFCLVSAVSSWAAMPVCGAETTASGSPPTDPQTLVATPSATGGVWIVHVGLKASDADNRTVSGVTSSAGGTFQLYGVNAEVSATLDVLSYVFYSVDYVGGSQTLSVDYSAAPSQGSIAQFVCTGVRLPNPWLGSATTNQAEANSISLSVPCRTGALAIDMMAVASLGAGLSPTVGADQTELYNFATGGDNLDSTASTESGAATNTMSWSAGTTEVWGSVGGCLVPPFSGGRPIFLD